jgi:type III restriction enzyme
VSLVHPVVPFEGTLIDDIASRMDLRVPNHEATVAVANAFDAAAGEPIEVICDLATAVGKTYLAGALIEYLAFSGIRHFVIVTPGRTIQDKTITNFTDGHPKSVLTGMDTRPMIITADNFNSGAVAAALADDTVVKLFIFTVQSLLRPDKSTRKTRKYQEWLGEDLYAYLRAQDDLVVLADEHHVYSKGAAFSAAVRDLDAMALIGLTATPVAADKPKVIYRYELARAISDKLVKTPVLVGRKDDRVDVDTRLRDGLLLLEAKQKTADDYAATTGKPPINAVMFIVADSIDNANAIADVLRKPGLFGDDYASRVLVIHSDAPDDALARLAAVEEPDSPVRVIVSVSMLKEGWDVKNIFVICSFRPSISEALTEQTLGRGLRMPWGAYTDVELLDTVEVLSHERYAQLLAQAGILLEGLVPDRTVVIPVPSPVPTPGMAAPGDGSVAVTTTELGADEVEVTAAVATTVPGTGDPETITPTVVIASVEQRTADAQAQAAAVAQPVKARTDVKVNIPKLIRTITARNFNLSSVPDAPFTALGKGLAGGAGTSFERKLLIVVEDDTAPTGYRLVPTDAASTIAASTPELPFGGAAQAIKQAILGFDFVPTDKAALNAAKRFADAVVAGAGGEQALASYVNAASHACHQILRKAWHASPPVITTVINDAPFNPARVNARTVEPNRYGKFSRKVAYSGWGRCLYPLNWFDSTPERTFANVVDSDDQVAVWTRIQRGEMTVEWNEGRYTPDFYVRAAQGTHYLVEVKADKDVDTALVQAKKQAAEDWARYVTDAGDYGTWSYLLVTEKVLTTAKTAKAVVAQSAT